MSRPASSRVPMLLSLRRVLAVAVLVLLTLAPLGLVRAAWLTRLQLVPALLSFHVVALLAVLVLTLVTGRSYCSLLCPLGIVQDVVRCLTGRRAQRYRSPLWGYVTCTLLLSAGIFGVVYAVYWLPALLDPFSHYGRICGQLLGPLWSGLSSRLSQWGIGMEPFQWLGHSPEAFAAAVGVAVVVAVLSWLWGRAYCHLLCPVGFVLGWVGRYPLLGIRVDRSRCTGCGACEQACKSSCLRAADGYVDRTRCVACLGCLQACPTGAIGYTVLLPLKRRRAASASTPADPSRRRALATAGTLLLSLPVARAQRAVDEYNEATRRVIDEGDGFVTYQYDQTKVRKVQSMQRGEAVVSRTYAIMPPATVSRDRFQARCVSCGLCVAHCPSHILRPVRDEYGAHGQMQPMVDFALGWCRPECNRCAEVCPSDAIRLLPLDEKRRDRLGWATFNSMTCVAVTDDVDCDACVRHCPMNAIQMVEHGGHKVPKVITRRCTGCGACEHYCPARPKAIHVEGLKW